MKFVDEATVRVIAGSGGAGSASFRREKFIPFGGPDGGDGGRGGHIDLVADSGLNTLVDFRHARLFRAANGAPGRGRQMTGASGADIEIRVPVGTIVKDADSGEWLGDLTVHGERLRVARGGRGGLGNLHFKSSTNRAPRQFTPGTAGEERNLYLELKLLADVGLLGLPNAGKSTLVSRLSAARPKIADYPFTTLHPALGVVRLGPDESFVIADIPGIISGAAQGAGLGLRFLRHLDRTRLLLHLVALEPDATPESLAAEIREVAGELEEYRAELVARPRWLVFTKADLRLPEASLELARETVAALGWEGPWYAISAPEGSGLKTLALDIYQALGRLQAARRPDEPESARDAAGAAPEHTGPGNPDGAFE